MSENSQLPNDQAARSPTGEILPPNTQTQTEKAVAETRDQTTPTNQDQSKEAEKPTEKKEAEGEKSVLNDKKDEKKEEAKGAPEKYEDFKLPEGWELTEEAKTEATGLFKSLGLNQEQAQKLVDFHVKATQEAADAPLNLWQKQQNDWKNEITNDPKLGPRIAEIKANFSKMLDGLENPELATAFREAMDFTGAGNNPAFVRVMDALAKRLTEGGNVNAGKPSALSQQAPGQATGTGARALYPGLA